MVAKDRPTAKGSPKVEVGEIDTRAPFQSVKDAVSMFGEGALSGEKPSLKKAKAYSAERVLARETQLHMAQKELNKLKEQLKSAETTKTEALVELERAKRTLEDLNKKLKTATEAKESAIKATDLAKNQAKQLGEENGINPVATIEVVGDLEAARQEYLASMAELNAAKQELRKIRQNCDATVEEKITALKQATEAEHAVEANGKRSTELSKEIAFVHESIEEVKLEITQAEQEQAKIYREKEVKKKSYRTAIEEHEKKAAALQTERDLELAKDLKTQLAEKECEIEKSKKEMENARESDMDSVKSVTLELDNAKESLRKVAEEENSLRSLLESLKQELEAVKEEHAELKEKEAETESIAGNLHVKLRKTKAELESAFVEESKARNASEELVSSLLQLSSENESAKVEAEGMKKQAEDLTREAEETKNNLNELEKRLTVALTEAEEAKAAEARALEEIKILSDRTSAARSSTSDSDAQITVSREEFESMSRKVEESEKLAEMKVEAAMAQVEAVRASEREAVKRAEAIEKEIADIRAATEAAVKRAEMAEAAKRAVEGELRRRREREQKKAAEAASRILAESESMSLPSNFRVQKPAENQHPVAGKAVSDDRKLEKGKSLTLNGSTKALLHNFSGVFQRKRNQVEGGASPSYLPGEKPI